MGHHQTISGAKLNRLLCDWLELVAPSPINVQVVLQNINKKALLVFVQ